jgi:hypothetical protein
LLHILRKIIIPISCFLILHPFHSKGYNQSVLDSLQNIIRTQPEQVNSTVYLQIGQEYYTLYTEEGYKKAFRYFKAGLNRAKEEMDIDKTMISYRLMAGAYDALNYKLDSAAYLYEKYWNYVKDSPKTHRKIDALRNLMVIFNKLNQPAKVEYYANELYNLLKNYNGYRHYNYKNQLAHYYTQNQMYNMGQSLFTPIDWEKYIGDDDEAVRHFYLAAYDLLMYNNQPDSAVSLLEAILSKTSLHYDSSLIIQKMYEACAQIKNREKALEISSLKLQEIEREVSRLSKELDDCRNENSKETLNEEKPSPFSGKWMYIGIIIGISLFVRLILKKKRQ